MSFWNAITGVASVDKTLDIADKTLTGVGNGLDKLFYTDEEKADTLNKRMEIAEKISQTHIKLMEVTHSETTTRSITRRFTAISIMLLTFLSLVTICVAWKFDKEWAVFMLQVIQYFQIGWAFIAVVVFFFGNHMLTGAKK